MFLPSLSLVFLVGAIVLGYIKKLNVGFVALGLSFILYLIGKVSPNVLFNGFPTKLFITLLGTMFLFSLLQENKTIELLSKKMLSCVGSRVFFIPIIVYLSSYLLSAAGPGAISTMSVTIIFAVSIAVQMSVSPIMLASLAYIGAVGGTASPIALTGIIVTGLLNKQMIFNTEMQVFLGVTIANIICATLVYVYYRGYSLKSKNTINFDEIPAFDKQQKISLFGLAVMVFCVVVLRYDVGLTSFAVALVLMVCGVVNEHKAIKSIPWATLILISGISVLMGIIQHMKGITLLANILASMMNESSAAAIITMTSGIMSWFSSANGVVIPTLIPTIPDIVDNMGGNISVVEMVIGIVSASTLSGISPLSTGGSLTLAAYVQETNINDMEQRKLFAELFSLSFAVMVIVAIMAFLGIFRLFS